MKLERSSYLPSRVAQVPLYLTPSLAQSSQPGEPLYYGSWSANEYLLKYSKVWPGKRGKGSKRSRLWNDFEHYSQSSVYEDPTLSLLRQQVPVLVGIQGINPPGYGVLQDLSVAPVNTLVDEFGSLGEFNKGLPSFHNALVRDGPGFIPAMITDTDDVQAAFIQRILHPVAKRLSLINSLIELKDFLTLRTSIDRLYKAGLKFVQRGASRKTLRELLGGAADGFLQWKFNISPLLSDIAGVYRAVTESTERVRVLLAREGRVQKAHASASFVEYDDVSEEIPYTYEDAYPNSPSGQSVGVKWGGHFRREVTYFPTEFHMEMLYCANFTTFQREHARGLAILDGLGVNLDPTIIWNAIPWSFVVDWMLHVGEFLSTLKTGLLDPQINIVRYLTSHKRYRIIEVSLACPKGVAKDYPEAYFGTESRVLKYPAVHESAYCRRVGFPPASSLQVSGLSGMQITLGAALVLSRRPRRQTNKSRRKFKFPTRPKHKQR